MFLDKLLTCLDLDCLNLKMRGLEQRNSNTPFNPRIHQCMTDPTYGPEHPVRMD